MIASGFLQHFLHRQKTVDDIQGVKRFSVTPDPVGFALAAGPFARFGQQRGPKMSSGLWAHPRTPSVSWRHVSSVTCGDVLPYRAVDVKLGVSPAS